MDFRKYRKCRIGLGPRSTQLLQAPCRGFIALARQFQSETDAIREAPEPLTSRITTALLAAFVVSLVSLTVFAYAEHGDQPERQAARCDRQDG